LHSDFCKVIESAAGEEPEEELTMEDKAVKEGEEGKEEEGDIFSEFFKTS